MNRSRRNIMVYGAALTAVIVFVGWLWNGSGARATSPPFEPVTKVTQGPYTVQVQLNSAEAVILKPNTFTVTIRESGEQPVSGAQVNIGLFMPDMFCGTGTFKMEEIRPGVYQGDGIPFMAGSSSADVKIEVAGRTYNVQHLFLAVR